MRISFVRYIFDIIVQVNWMPSANWFLWSNPIRDFFCIAIKDEYCHVLTIQCFFLKVFHTSYFFSVLFVSSKITYRITRVVQQHVFVAETFMVESCQFRYWIVYFFFGSLNRLVRISYTQSFRCLMKRAPQYEYWM